MPFIVRNSVPRCPAIDEEAFFVRIFLKPNPSEHPRPIHFLGLFLRFSDLSVFQILLSVIRVFITIKVYLGKYKPLANLTTYVCKCI